MQLRDFHELPKRRQMDPSTVEMFLLLRINKHL